MPSRVVRLAVLVVAISLASSVPAGEASLDAVHGAPPMGPAISAEATEPLASAAHHATALPSPSVLAPTWSRGASRGSARELLEGLELADEHPDGYDRGLFRLWVDADGDGCDTRREVLIAESTTAVAVGPGCSLLGGAWFSAYDAITTTAPSSFDIDHVVPLKEAWDSGAYAWDSTRRQLYANDLGDDRSLRAVSASSNRAKGDRDPADWLPPSGDFLCTYLDDWLVIKVRWGLTVDLDERAAISDDLVACPETVLERPRAVLGPVVAEPTGDAEDAVGCDAAYPDVCIPPRPPDLDCGDVALRRFTVLPPDPHRLDGDHDGIGCES